VLVQSIPCTQRELANSSTEPSGRKVTSFADFLSSLYAYFGEVCGSMAMSGMCDFFLCWAISVDRIGGFVPVMLGHGLRGELSSGSVGRFVIWCGW
jgi:hypothetical protein